MIGIFGIFNRNGAPVSPETVQTMRSAMAYWGPDGGDTWLEGCCGLGHLLLHNTPEARYEQLPRWIAGPDIAFTATARIDNRAELCRRFDIPADAQPTTPDSELMLRAYLRWGEACADHLLGDWSFAVWQPEKRRLFLARDHHGNTALYTYADRDRFVFASTKKALLALAVVPKQLNELRLAQILVSWPGDGVQTVHQGIERLPPAHTLTVTPQAAQKRRYWYLEDTPQLNYKRSEDYVAGFHEVFGEAVRCRLRSDRQVGATLSGGLDSGSVVALAGPLLAQQGRRLPTYSSVPLYDVSSTISPLRFGDETPYIRATAEHVGNVELNLLTSAHISPLTGLTEVLKILDAPTHAAGNMYWIVDILQTARAQGVGTLLTGQGGNATISWLGKPWLRPGTAPESLRNLKLRLQHDLLLPLLPPAALSGLARLRRATHPRTWQNTAINPAFAGRLQLAEQLEASEKGTVAGLLRRRDPRRMRFVTIQPGRAIVGALWHELGAAGQMEVRDPTTDKRVLAYTLAVPNREYTGPGATDRYLLRRAMRGRLPPQVLNAPRRGRQAADLVARLRAEAAGVEAELARFAASPPVNAYINTGRLAEAWRACHAAAPVTAMQTHQAVTIITRGMMAAAFLNTLFLAKGSNP